MERINGLQYKGNGFQITVVVRASYHGLIYTPLRITVSRPPLRKSLYLPKIKSIIVYMAQEQSTIRIPMSVFESAETKEDLEDWLLANDPTFVEDMRHLKAEADLGKGRPLEDLAKQWHIDL
jgi:hypothetical protein